MCEQKLFEETMNLILACRGRPESRELVSWVARRALKLRHYDRRLALTVLFSFQANRGVEKMRGYMARRLR